MQIRLTSILVDNQDAALEFYTNVVGFTKSADVNLGPLRWLTVSSPDGAAGAELVLEKTEFPPAQIYQRARFAAAIPALALTSNDLRTEYRLLKGRGAKFRGEPQDLGPILSAIFEDGCGNLIHLLQPKV